MMNAAGTLICLSILFCPVEAYARHFLPVQPPDSVPVVPVDSALQQQQQQQREDVKGSAVSADSILLQQQPDSVSKDVPDKGGVPARQDTVGAGAGASLFEITSDKFFAPSYMFSPSPRRAVLYSAIFPGLGQIYNRKYWKLPILYGGFFGLSYAITWNNGYYRDYLGAYQDIMDDNPNTDSWSKMLPYGQDQESVDVQWFTNVLRQRKDHYRYYRDLSIIATAAVYLIAMVDAYVDAQLFDFDMSPDLSMRMTPVIIREERNHSLGSTSYGVQWSFNF